MLRLGVDRVDTLLAPSATDLFSDLGPLMWDRLRALKDAGLAKKIGVSVYASDDPVGVARHFKPDVLQAPASLLDQRLLLDGSLETIAEMGIEVHLRSIFLQGLLLMELDAIPGYFMRHRPTIEDYLQFVAGNQWTKLQGALSFALAQTNADAVVIGVTNAAELSEILSSANNPVSAGHDFSRFAVNDPDFVDPAKWRLAN